MQLFQASHQWRSRADDERYTSLDDMLAHFRTIKAESRQTVASSHGIRAIPDDDHKGLMIEIDGETEPYCPTHHSFGQLATLGKSPAYYLHTLPSPLAADCVNYGLQFKRDIADVGLLLHRNGSDTLRAATGPEYGRIWNADVVAALMDRFGDGISGVWRVPGEFGKAVEVTKANTTLFGSDRDMFCFLADEQNRIEIPGRRGGRGGSLARGFFVWNSEVGDRSVGLGFFLFDYTCSNRIVWGVHEYNEVRISHTKSAPDKYVEKMMPVIDAYANAAASSTMEAIEQARQKRLDDKLDEFLAKRFARTMATSLKAIHEVEEGRPIETLWDVATAATAYARSIPHQNRRVELERKAGELLRLAA
jgi:hypothetical protein